MYLYASLFSPLSFSLAASLPHLYRVDRDASHAAAGTTGPISVWPLTIQHQMCIMDLHLRSCVASAIKQQEGPARQRTGSKSRFATGALFSYNLQLSAGKRRTWALATKDHGRPRAGPRTINSMNCLTLYSNVLGLRRHDKEASMTRSTTLARCCQRWDI